MTPYIATEVTIGGYVVEREIARYIQEASISTGVSLRYLLAKAGQESSFTANARAGSTSATGMYQFTNVTWFELFKKNGAKYGYPELAKKITYSKRYRYSVKDRAARKKILALRLEPQISALLAAEYARSNQAYIERYLKRDISSTDLYLAHFLGPVGAVKLLDAANETPRKYAYKVFPRAAKANPRIFYKKHKSGARKARTVSEVHGLIERLFESTIRRFTNLPPDVFIKIPQVVPTSRKPSNDWFAGYSMVSERQMDFSDGFKDGHSLAEMLYRQSRSTSGDVVDLDSIDAVDNSNDISIVISDANEFLSYEEISDLDILSLIPEEDVTIADIASLNVINDLGVNLDDVSSEMLDPVFQINRTFFSSSSKIFDAVSEHLDTIEVSSLTYDALLKRNQERVFQLAMIKMSGENNTGNLNVFGGFTPYSISTEDAAFVKDFLSSLSVSSMAEPLTTQAMNTFEAIKGAYNHVGSLNSKILFVPSDEKYTASF